VLAVIFLSTTNRLTETEDSRGSIVKEGDRVPGVQKIWHRLQDVVHFVVRDVGRLLSRGGPRVFFSRYTFRLVTFFAVVSAVTVVGFQIAESLWFLHAPDAVRESFRLALERGDSDTVVAVTATRDEDGRWHAVPREWGELLITAYHADPVYREWLDAQLSPAEETISTGKSPLRPFSLLQVGRSYRIYIPAIYVWVARKSEEQNFLSNATREAGPIFARGAGHPDQEPRPSEMVDGQGAFWGDRGSFIVQLRIGTREGEYVYPLPKVGEGKFGPIPPIAAELCSSIEVSPAAEEDSKVEPHSCTFLRKLSPEQATASDALIWWIGDPHMSTSSLEVWAPVMLENAIRYAVSFDEALRKRDASLLEGTSEELRALFSDMIAQGELPASVPELRPRRIRFCLSNKNPRRVIDNVGDEFFEADVEEEWESGSIVRWRYRFRRENSNDLTIVAVAPMDGRFSEEESGSEEGGEKETKCLWRNTDLVYVIGFDGGIVPHRNERDPQGEEASAVRRWVETHGGVARFHELSWPDGIAALRRGDLDGYFGAISLEEAARLLPDFPYVVLEIGEGRRTVLLLVPHAGMK